MRNQPLCKYGLVLLILNILFGQGAFADGESWQTAVNLYYQGRISESVQMLRKIVAAQPDRTMVRRDLATVLRQSGLLDEAIDQLTIANQQDPTDPKIRAGLAETAYLAGKPLRLATTAWELEPGDDLFWRALSFVEQSKPVEAALLLNRMVLANTQNAYAYYLLGLIHHHNNDPSEAAIWYKKAFSVEPRLLGFFIPLGNVVYGPGKLAPVYDLLQRAQAMQSSQAVTQTEMIGKLTDLGGLPDPALSAAEKASSEAPELKIGLGSGVGTVKLKTDAGLVLQRANGETVYYSSGPAVLSIAGDGDGVSVKNESERVVCTVQGNLDLKYLPSGARTGLYDGRYRDGSVWIGRIPQVYRGNFRFIPGANGLTVVNRIGLEDYLYSVLPSEIPSRWPFGALQAQTVAARTYALANLGRYAAQGFDLLATPVSQAYKGVREETERARAAVDSTRGLILTYGGKPAATFYHDNSGGYTEAAESVWSNRLPYLKALPEQPLNERTEFLSPAQLDDWLTETPDSAGCIKGCYTLGTYRWTAWVPRDLLEERINAKAPVGKITAVIPLERGISGRVRRVFVRGAKGDYVVQGDALPYLLGGLRSSLFVVAPKLGKDRLPEFFVFRGGGWGHGVGMSQTGAAGMAARGSSFREILSYYYPETELVKKY